MTDWTDQELAEFDRTLRAHLAPVRRRWRRQFAALCVALALIVAAMIAGALM